MNRKRTPRRGAILLVVLSVLVLFALVGITFVVTAGQFYRAAAAGRNNPVNIDEPTTDADSLIMDVLRGPKLGTSSALLGPDLLRDLYGRESRRGTISTVRSATFPSANPDVTEDMVFMLVTPKTGTSFVPIENYYDGCVMTFLDGDAKDCSVRILKYDMTDINNDGVYDWFGFYVEAPTYKARVNAPQNDVLIPAANDTVLINGRPFSGTGFGYSDISRSYRNGASLRLMDSIGDITTAAGPAMQLPVALMPNFSAYAADGVVTDPFVALAPPQNQRFVDHGGADEPWDAPDYQNMALSYYFNNGVPDPLNGSNDVLPSYHRPDLIAYWYKRLSKEWSDTTNNDGFADLTAVQRAEMWLHPYGADNIRNNSDDVGVVDFNTFPLAHRDALVELKRRIILRPLVEDNPNFNGSNPGYNHTRFSDIAALSAGLQWDVDNDRDGIPDSIWIDPGFPIATDKDGRRYKKLAAILVQDQDGRLNLNAAGFYTQFQTLDPANYVYTLIPTDGTGTSVINAPLYSANASNDMKRLLGVGYGPADLDLRRLFNPPAPATPIPSGPEELYNILASRYGRDNNPKSVLPGKDGTRDYSNERLELYTEIGLPLAWGTSGIGEAYGSYPLIADGGMSYLDYTGRLRIVSSPISYAGVTITNSVDDPYELNLVHPQGTDAPFSASDLEALLRRNDYDGNYLSSRLQFEAPVVLANAGRRAALTTHSFSMKTLPAPPIPLDLRPAFTPDASVTIRPQIAGDQINGGRAQANSGTWSGSTPTIYELACERARRALHDDERDAGGGVVTPYMVDIVVASTLPFEVIKGSPMDLNRLFRSPVNGVDEDTDGATDEYNEQINLPNLGNYNPRYVNDYGNDRYESSIASAGDYRNRALRASSADQRFVPTFPKQLYARHLFCLALLLHDAGYELPLLESAENAGFTAEQRRELTVRRLAQWAINVVDFRDNDAIMTPFEYDANPFDGWGVDGDLISDESQAPYNLEDRRIVWGAEQPDVLITETLNTHDRRVKDTDFDDSANAMNMKKLGSGDLSMDQYRIPQGSTFIELYMARNLPYSSSVGNATKLPAELYNLSTGRLQLGKLAPNGAPVWRMVVTKNQSAAGDKLLGQIKDANDRVNTIMFQPNEAPLSGTVADPAKFNVLNGTGASDPLLEIDRVFWFTSATLPGSLSYLNDVSFKYRDPGTLEVAPNRFFVAGPRPVTYFGSAPDAASTYVADINTVGGHYLQLGPVSWTNPALANPASNVGYTTAIPGDAYPASTAIQGVNYGIFTAPVPTGWATPTPTVDPDELTAPASGADVGMNISEPLPAGGSYYKEPIDPQGEVLRLGHYSEANPIDDTNMPATQIPDDPFDSKTGAPLKDAGALATGTYKDFKGLLLQRLADPTREYDPAYNPYITVDWASLDLQVFNGEDHNGAHSANPDPEDGNGDNGNAIQFGSLQRGVRNTDPITGRPDGNVLGWVASAGNLVDRANRTISQTSTEGYVSGTTPTPRDALFTVGGQQEHFARALKHSIGYVNKSLGIPLPGGNNQAAEYVGSPVNGVGPVDPIPYAFLHWPDSPFVSAHDLMLVPTSAPQRLTLEYSLFNANTNIDQYGGADPADDVEQAKDYLGRFGGLFNFFDSRYSYDIGSGSTGGQYQRRSHMNRLFDYVNVPSRFVGTERYYNAADYTGSTLTDNMTSVNDSRDGFRFPFNKRSEYRDPGKVNLNTMASGYVFNAIFDPNYFQDANVGFPDWTAFQQSRAGSDGSDRFNSSARDFPSWFANPFRSAGASDMMPPIEPLNATPTYNNALRVSEVDATVLRSKKLLVDSAGTTHTIGTNTGDQPLFGFTTPNPASAAAGSLSTRYNDATISPANRYQGIRRLDNLTTNQSNVYAVWITLGYFEVEPTPISPVHPDGWRLGQELGSDIGEVERHRSFYLIDRSIPVGYEPGEDHNVEDAILLKRRID
ncbi:hypothetical protein LOC68_05905 [Blastopirellula sp. JC732]|uniref:Uncharacterized protein n=1 Tax=Blastopirellula sediminis TaxID=2894196 RepID=A0A9X1ML50_9BACT|nr:hypothetical protein [Blastopirellula sediminis]MCC9609301.1 hypothetical protein [Blastopirellula sediminis]MCC9627922.1 hypothetical protein [Blastopirellula sediminis]